MQLKKELKNILKRIPKTPVQNGSFVQISERAFKTLSRTWKTE
jgi:hypothetical protein